MSLPISGFTAIYNPQMMAMMPIQSLIMMYEAGFGWQFGKRKASELSNEEVKQMTLLTVMEHMNQMRRDALPMIQRAMDDMTPMTAHLMENFGDIIREAIKALPSAVGNIFGQSYQGPNDPYGQLTNVRLSQGSQQWQRDRELYAGGATSQYQMDVERQKERDRQQASLEADAIRRQKEIDRRKEISKTVQMTPNIQRLHQRFGKTSTQTLQLAVVARLKAITALAKKLVTLPKTVQQNRKYTVWSAGGNYGRVRYKKVTVSNQAIYNTKKQLEKVQQDVLDYQAYIQWRKNN